VSQIWRRPRAAFTHEIREDDACHLSFEIGPFSCFSTRLLAFMIAAAGSGES